MTGNDPRRVRSKSRCPSRASPASVDGSTRGPESGAAVESRFPLRTLETCATAGIVANEARTKSETAGRDIIRRKKDGWRMTNNTSYAAALARSTYPLPLGLFAVRMPELDDAGLDRYAGPIPYMASPHMEATRGRLESRDRPTARAPASRSRARS